MSNNEIQFSLCCQPKCDNRLFNTFCCSPFVDYFERKDIYGFSLLLVVDEVVADIDIAIAGFAVTLLNYEFTKFLNRKKTDKSIFFNHAILTAMTIPSTVQSSVLT